MRVNVESKWWTDPRRRVLRNLLGRDCTEQVAVNAWHAGATYWLDRDGQLLIPGEVFVFFDGWKELIQSGLAILYNVGHVDSTEFRTNIEHVRTRIEHDGTDPNIVKKCFVYLAGMRDSFSTFVEKRQQRADAGRKSAEKRRVLYGTSQPKLERTPNAPERTPNAPEPTISTSSSSSNRRIIHMGSDEPLNAIFDLYPKRQGSHRKAQGFDRLRRILSEGKEDDFKRAVVAYSEECRRSDKIGTAYVCQFATFTNKIWLEYVNRPDLMPRPKPILLAEPEDPDVKAARLDKEAREAIMRSPA